MRTMRIIASMGFEEIKRIPLADGWHHIVQKGSHSQYARPTESGKGTVPDHRGDVSPYIAKDIWKQTDINEKRTK